jgi:phosphate transport system substrate-binding protein
VSAQAAVLLNGAGATFPYPLYSKWFDEFHKLHPDITMNYQSIGSGAGIRQMLEGTVDFGASDGPMTDEQLAQARVPLQHLPTVLGADVPVWNLPGYNLPINEMRFTPEVLAGIFLGKITRWNDPALAVLNPSVKFPDAEIVVVHRSDGSGTTYVWTDYLSKVSPEWAERVGKGTSVNWPVGLGGKGNDGVAELVQQTPNSFGYVELIYAVLSKTPHGAVRNRAGNFVRANGDSVAAAAAGVTMPADFRVSITDTDAPTGYPIASFTWLLTPTRMADDEKRKALRLFLDWMLADGQQLAPALLYAPLPPSVVTLERRAITKMIQLDGP